MGFYLIGIDYKSADLTTRETLYRQRDQIADFFGQRAMALFTCNRIEIYGEAIDGHRGWEAIGVFQRRFPGFAGRGYAKWDQEDILRHALRLATGLESQLKGEREILEQLTIWFPRESKSDLFFRFWKKITGYSEDIRRRAGLNHGGYNVANLIYADIKKNFGYKKELKAVIVGTGKIAELFTGNREQGVCLSFVAHRNRGKGEALARRAGGKMLLLRDLPDSLIDTDVVVAATGSQNFVLRKDLFDKVLFKKDQPLYVYDLAVPRDVDPEAGKLENLVLYNLDDLTLIAGWHNREIKMELKLAEYLVEEKVKEGREALRNGAFEDWLASEHACHKAGI